MLPLPPEDPDARIEMTRMGGETPGGSSTNASTCGFSGSGRTFEDKARDGSGPKYQKLGKGRSARVVYRVGDLLAWLNSQTRASTTTDPEAA